mmetsp:Transcript_107762/g.292123  ORF Transcript_107762/g.292123 Transcript_107762/m.292123 type:complete len:346 (-) Transcript_107762:303-1340(-)
MHPGGGVLLPIRRLALGDLVLVVWEDEVGATSMDVQGVPQVLLCHSTALDVPAGSARSPGRLPRGLARLGRLPEHEVLCGLLLRAHLHAGPSLVVLHLHPGQTAVSWEAAHSEVHVQATLAPALVGMPLVHQRLCHAEDLGQVLGHAGLHRRGLAPEGQAVRLHLLLEPSGEGFRGLARLCAAFDDLVVDVGDVPHVADVVSQLLKVPGNQVKKYHDSSMPKVAQIINGNPADVHVDSARPLRLQRLLLAGERIVDLHHWTIIRGRVLGGWPRLLWLGRLTSASGCTSLSRKGELPDLLRHELEHVEKTVVPARRQRGRNTRGLDEFWPHAYNLLRSTPAEAAYE